MTQREFTEYVILKIIERFPQFEKSCTAKPADIVDIDYKSPKGQLVFWLTTQNKEITVGFTGVTDASDWHMHMSQFGANAPDEELEAVMQLTESILNDREKIVYSTVLGYFISDDIDGLEEYKYEKETIDICCWSQL